MSFAYFLAKFCYIEDKELKAPMLFKLWPTQERILPKILDSMLLVILKARQLGLTWLCAAYCLWFVITKPMKLIVVISAKGDWAVEFMDRVYFIMRLLPAYLLPKIIKQTSENLVVEFPGGLQSTLKSIPTTEAGAQSKTPDVLILDETCWNPYIREIYNASKPGIVAAAGRIIAISNSIKTAPGWGWTRDIFTGAMKNENDFDWIFMPWWDRPGRATDEEIKQFEKDGTHPKAFIEGELRGGMHPDDAKAHYPATIEEAISAISGSYFGKSLARHDKPVPGIKGRLTYNKQSKLVDFAPETHGILEVWRYPYYLLADYDEIPWERRYCIGSDVSEGLGQSYSVAYVMDRKSQEFIARLRSNRVDAHTWAKLLYWLSDYYSYSRPSSGESWHEKERALICVETTGAGQTTVHELKHLNANLYVQLAAGKVGSEVTKRFGWHESNQAKHDMSEDLRHFLISTLGKIYCPILVNECSTWILHDNGQVGPEDSTRFGDCVVGAGLTVQADIFMEGSPRQIMPPLTGWRARFEEKGRSNWAL